MRLRAPMSRTGAVAAARRGGARPSTPSSSSTSLSQAPQEHCLHNGLELVGGIVHLASDDGFSSVYETTSQPVKPPKDLGRLLRNVLRNLSRGGRSNRHRL